MYVLLVHVPYLAFQACMSFAGLQQYGRLGLQAHLGDSSITTLGLGRAQDWASGRRRRVFTDKELQQ